MTRKLVVSLVTAMMAVGAIAATSGTAFADSGNKCTSTANTSTCINSGGRRRARAAPRSTPDPAPRAAAGLAAAREFASSGIPVAVYRLSDHSGTVDVVRELAAVPVSGLTSAGLGAAISRVIEPLVRHDGLRMVGYGPSAQGGLGSFSFIHGYEPDFGRALYHGISVGDDPFPIRVLEQQAVPGAVVATGRMFGEYGVGEELRVALRTPRGVWGTIGLLRGEDVKPFTDNDTVAIAALIPALVDLLRRYVTAAPLVPSGPAPTAGIAMMGHDHRIRAATPEAQQWLDMLRDDKGGPPWAIDAGLAILSLHARTASGPPPLIVGPAASYGRWIALQAQVLDGEVAVILQQATGDRVLPAFGDWYGLTTREREVLGQLYGASPPKQIARLLNLSVYTVNEHLKAVYRKTGASSRDEFVAALAG